MGCVREDEPSYVSFTPAPEQVVPDEFFAGTGITYVFGLTSLSRVCGCIARLFIVDETRVSLDVSKYTRRSPQVTHHYDRGDSRLFAAAVLPRWSPVFCGQTGESTILMVCRRAGKRAGRQQKRVECSFGCVGLAFSRALTFVVAASTGVLNRASIWSLLAAFRWTRRLTSFPPRGLHAVMCLAVRWTADLEWAVCRVPCRSLRVQMELGMVSGYLLMYRR